MNRKLNFLALNSVIIAAALIFLHSGRIEALAVVKLSVALQAIGLLFGLSETVKHEMAKRLFKQGVASRTFPDWFAIVLDLPVLLALLLAGATGWLLVCVAAILMLPAVRDDIDIIIAELRSHANPCACRPVCTCAKSAK